MLTYWFLQNTGDDMVTLGDVIDPTQIIEKPLLSPKLSPSEILRIMDPLNR